MKFFRKHILPVIFILTLSMYAMLMLDSCKAKRGVCGLTKRQGRIKSKQFSRMVRMQVFPQYVVIKI